jgi:HlyD family secretion protein
MLEFLCALPVVAAFLSACDPAPPLATGYVEGAFRLIAPVEAARIADIAVRRGDRVAMGDRLIRMERRDAEIAFAEAEAALAEAESRLANLREGRRSEEIAVIVQSLQSAVATAEEAAREAERQRDLHARGVAPIRQVEIAQTALDVARARVREIESNLDVARLPAREHEIAAAEAGVDRARAAREAARWRLGQRSVAAPAAGRITDILRRAGEIGGPAAPVLEMLPDGAAVLRLYVPEAAIAGIGPGDRLAVGCDGCPDGLTATVTWVADGPEFTPPVIYSLENRQKLVFMVEARPDPGAEMLKPGQIVDVRRAAAE